MGSIASAGKGLLGDMKKSIFSGNTGSVLRDPRFWLGAVLSAGTNNTDKLIALTDSLFLANLKNKIAEAQAEKERAWKENLLEREWNLKKNYEEGRLNREYENKLNMMRELERMKQLEEEQKRVRRRESFTKFWQSAQKGKIDPEAFGELWAIDPKTATSILSKMMGDKRIDPIQKFALKSAIDAATKVTVDPEQLPAMVDMFYKHFLKSLGSEVALGSGNSGGGGGNAKDEIRKYIDSLRQGNNTQEGLVKEKPDYSEPTNWDEVYKNLGFW